ncbi:MAG: Hpt domain-containing protein [Actinomycetota bacterium]
MLPEQLQRIIGYFLEETTEHLQTVEQGLVDLQSTIDAPERVHQVIRATHSVKGGAAMLGFSSIQRIAHRLEDYLKLLRECPLRVDRRLELLLQQVFGSLKELVQQISRTFGLNQEVANQIMAGVEPVFEALNEHLRVLIPTRLTIRATSDEHLHIFAGYCRSLSRFSQAISQCVTLLGGTITRHEQDGLNQRLSLDLHLPPYTRLESIREAIRVAGGIIGTVQTQRDFSLFSGPEYPIHQVALERPQTCIGCRFYYGRNDGGYLLNCAVHPSGPEEEHCRDRSEE